MLEPEPISPPLIDRQLLGEDAMVSFGQELGVACQGQRVVVFLEGDLGMGKTTISRGVVQAFGYKGAVKSPTYTLVEPYEFDNGNVYHFDLYRLGHPEELEYMGIRDYFEGDNTLCLLEWADKGGMFLPAADIVVRISFIDGGRQVKVIAQTGVGRSILLKLSQ